MSEILSNACNFSGDEQDLRQAVVVATENIPGITPEEIEEHIRMLRGKGRGLERNSVMNYFEDCIDFLYHR